MGIFESVFVTPWPWWGAALGIVAIGAALLAIEGRRLGVSGGLGAALGLAPVSGGACNGGDTGKSSSWRGWFLVGLPLGGLLASVGAPNFALSLSMGSLDAYAGSFGVEALFLVGGGLMIGWGTRQGGGCTSGHGIMGCALTKPNSIAATAVFFATGALVANLVRVFGAAS